MLHEETVDKATFQLLKDLQSKPYMQDFNLVGGTALSLLIGHRKSIDIDLFTNKGFDSAKLLSLLKRDFKLELSSSSNATILCRIDNVKVDIISHKYKWLEKPIEYNGIRLVGFKDLAAMKLNAIVGSGDRLKDFVDLAFLSTKMNFNEMMKSYEEKYPSMNRIAAARSVLYHSDIVHNVDLKLMKGTYSWQPIKDRLKAMYQSPNQIFKQDPTEKNTLKRGPRL